MRSPYGGPSQQSLLLGSWHWGSSSWVNPVVRRMVHFRILLRSFGGPSPRAFFRSSKFGSPKKGSGCSAAPGSQVLPSRFEKDSLSDPHELSRGALKGSETKEVSKDASERSKTGAFERGVEGKSVDQSVSKGACSVSEKAGGCVMSSKDIKLG